MKNLTNRLVLLVGLLALIPLSACGGSDSSTGPGGQRNAPSAITVLADSSLRAVFTQLGKQFENQNAGSTVTFTFGASADLAKQAAAGDPGDVLATTDQASMVSAQSAQLNSPSVFASKNGQQCQIAVLRQSKNTSLSQSFVNLVTGPAGQKALKTAGFGAP
jgi:ABC-type molybdate transport system substrate-binding protein